MIATYIVACIGAIPAIVSAIIAARNGRKANEIKVMVDGRLDQALTEIKDLKQDIQGRKDADIKRETEAPRS